MTAALGESWEVAAGVVPGLGDAGASTDSASSTHLHGPELAMAMAEQKTETRRNGDGDGDQWSAVIGESGEIVARCRWSGVREMF